MANIVYAGQNLTTYFSTSNSGDVNDPQLTLAQFKYGDGGSDRYNIVEPPYWVDSSEAKYTLWSNATPGQNARNTYYNTVIEYVAGTPSDAYGAGGSPEVNITWGVNEFVVRNNTPNSTLTINFSYSYRRVTTDAIQFQLRRDGVTQQSWAPTTTEVPSATNTIAVTSNNFTLVNTGSPVTQTWSLFSSITAGSGTDYIAARWFRVNFVSLA
jgi:hypothetical protein